MPRPARTDARVDLAVLAACCLAALVFLVLPATTRGTSAAVLRGSVVAPLAALQARSEMARRALFAGEGTARLTDSVTLRSLRLEGVEQENERLRKVLGLASALRWGFVPAEALQGRGLGDETTVALSAGANAGVTPLSPVVAPEGLVGMVERVDRTMSLAIVWPHPDFRVSAMAVDGSAYGIVRAHPGGQDASRYYLEMQGVAFRSQIKPGTLIVASGLGQVYPRGIPIGTVVQELRTSEGFARSYLVRPAVRLPDVNSVLILKAERVKGALENIWERAPNTDSTAKAILSAADSVRTLRTTDSLRAVRAARPLADSVPPRTDSAVAAPGKKKP